MTAPLIEVEVTDIADMPGKLRLMAAISGVVTVDFSDETARRLARVVEAGLAGDCQRVEAEVVLDRAEGLRRAALAHEAAAKDLLERAQVATRGAAMLLAMAGALAGVALVLFLAG